jgi:hypothetical protein
MLTMPLINTLANDRILEDSKFIVGHFYQLLIISNNSCHSATELAVVLVLRGVLKPLKTLAQLVEHHIRDVSVWVWSQLEIMGLLYNCYCFWAGNMVLQISYYHICACAARDKAIVSMKIIRSRDLGIWVAHKQNECIYRNSQKRLTSGFEFLVRLMSIVIMAFLLAMRAYQLHPLVVCFLLMHILWVIMHAAASSHLCTNRCRCSTWSMCYIEL